MAELRYTYQNPVSERDMKDALQVLNRDGVIAFPTDVYWAFACDSRSQKAMARIRQLKPSHPKSQPFSLICDSFSMVSEYGSLSQSAYRLLKRILPGPYTIILKSSKILPKQIKDKRKVVGVRIPQSELVLELTKRFGFPLATTSLPLPQNTEAPLSYGYEIEQYFGHAIDMILDLGEKQTLLETTIIDCVEEGDFQILRHGAGDTQLFEDLL